MSPFHFQPGNYSCLPGGPFSLGVTADAGYALHRARFQRLVPMAAGFAAIEQHLKRLGRPLPALAACELRSSRPVSHPEFQEFNAGYVTTLRNMGCQAGDVNPTGRSNVAPIFEVPTEPMFAAFTYTMPDAGAEPTRTLPSMTCA